MKTMKQIRKGLIGTSVLSLFAAGTAFAGGTQAGTQVKNTFSLDYKVGGVDQVTIETCQAGDSGCTTETSTNFTVDRLVDLTVASSADTVVAPGQQDAQLVYTVRNDGNDYQAYSFALINEATGDQFDATGLNITYHLDDGNGGVCDANDIDAGGTAYTPGSNVATVDLAADATICVVVDGDINTSVVDTNESKISLIATTLYATDAGGSLPGTVVTADTDGNTLTGAGAEENVMADAQGTASSGDAANDGAHSATGKYIVASADLDAEKTVSMHTMDASACATIPGVAQANVYSVPGACVEYKITVENTGATADATNISISDNLPDELIFIEAAQSVFTGAPLYKPPANTDCIDFDLACHVRLTGGTLAPGATGVLTIRALIKTQVTAPHIP